MPSYGRAALRHGELRPRHSVHGGANRRGGVALSRRATTRSRRPAHAHDHRIGELPGSKSRHRAGDRPTKPQCQGRCSGDPRQSLDTYHDRQLRPDIRHRRDPDRKRLVDRVTEPALPWRSAVHCGAGGSREWSQSLHGDRDSRLLPPELLGLCAGRLHSHRDPDAFIAMSGNVRATPRGHHA